eukprot:tig00000849_g4767.t1
MEPFDMGVDLDVTAAERAPLDPDLETKDAAKVDFGLAHELKERVEELQRGFPGPRFLQAKDVAQFVSEVDNFLLDCDGVLWQGANLLEGTLDTLALLKKLGKRVFFVTNNSTKSRRQYIKKFEALGIRDVTPDQIVCSAFSAAAFLDTVGFAHSKKKVYVIGEEGVELELMEHNIRYVSSKDHLGMTCTTESFPSIEVDRDIAAVVVAYDGSFSFYKVVYAALHLHEIPGCLLVVTNRDGGDVIDGRIMPGAGVMVAAVDAARLARGDAGMPALVNVGKPEPFTLDFLCNKYGLDRSRSCMVGDRLDTDVAFGRRGGLRTLAVLTGVTCPKQLGRTPAEELPDFVIPSFAHLLNAKPRD